MTNKPNDGKTVTVKSEPNCFGFFDYYCPLCGKLIHSRANGLGDSYRPKKCKDCGAVVIDR